MLRTISRTLLCAVLAGATACASYDAAKPAAAPEPSPAREEGAPPGEAELIVTASKESAPAMLGGMATGLRGPALAAPPPPPPPPRPQKTHEPAKPRPPADGAKPGAEGENASEVAAIRAPMLVYTADVTMAVFEVNAALARIEALARELGGFLAKRTDQSITIRVPVARFDEALKRVEATGDMLHRNVTAEDVTEEFRDLEVRLKNLRAVRERLTELLAKANKVEESVLIERELERVAMEIDRIEGRMKFLRDRASFSTITVTFQAKPKESIGAGAVRLPGPWLYDLGLGRLLRL